MLNGMPFLKYHIHLFKNLPYNWHWHIIEGVAALKYDTQWSVLRGGKIEKGVHKNGLSVDGTTEYLDLLKKTYPDHVSVYRKGKGKFWEGKVDMVNAPIPNLPHTCLLWQVDVDEFWTLEAISAMMDMFSKYPQKMGAYVYCDYFVGPRKFVESMNTWATLSEDWIRIFRYYKGFHWLKHEPPTLVDVDGVDWARKRKFSRNETLRNGIKFQHFAYVDKSQVLFKESYYGYHDAVNYWKKLQEQNGSVEVASFLPWATEGAKARDWIEERDGKLLFPGEWML